MQNNVMLAVQEFIPFFSLNRLYILGMEECRNHIAFNDASDDIAAYFVGASKYIINKHSLYGQDLDAYNMLLSMAIDGSFGGLIEFDDYLNVERKLQNDSDFMVHQKFYESGKRNIAVFRDGNFEVKQGSYKASSEERANMPKMYVNQSAAEELAYMLGATASSFNKLRGG